MESKLTSLKKYVQSLDAVMVWVMETRDRLNVARDLQQQDRAKAIDTVMVSVYLRLDLMLPCYYAEILNWMYCSCVGFLKVFIFNKAIKFKFVLKVKYELKVTNCILYVMSI